VDRDGAFTSRRGPGEGWVSSPNRVAVAFLEPWRAQRGRREQWSMKLPETLLLALFSVRENFSFHW
jgi:hypothetical protein